MQQFKKNARFLYCLAYLFCLLTLSAEVRADGSISIDLHGTNQVVQGSSFNVSLSVQANQPILKVSLWTSIGTILETVNGNTYEYTITVNPHCLIGQWSLIGEAILEDGSSLKSSEAFIFIEPSIQFSELKLQVGPGHFTYIGQSMPIKIYGMHSTNKEFSLIDSSRISFRSLNPNIAVLDSLNRAVIAKSAGTALIEAAYTNTQSQNTLVTTAEVVINSHIVGDFNGNGQVDIGDLKILKSALVGEQQSLNLAVEEDERDVNRDGNINNNDLKELISLCSLPNCNYFSNAIEHTYENWASMYFRSEAADKGKTDNPDNDDYVNLWEYALNLNPLADESSIDPLEMGLINGQMRIRYRKNIYASDLELQLKSSTDSSNWDTFWFGEEDLRVSSIDASTQLITITDPRTSLDRVFYKLEIIPNEAMPAIQSLFPVFAQIVNLNITKTGYGSVTSSSGNIDCGALCSFSTFVNTREILNAAPSLGHSFLGWEGACSGQSNTCYLDLNSSKSVHANFSNEPINVITATPTAINTPTVTKTSTPTVTATLTATTTLTTTRTPTFTATASNTSTSTPTITKTATSTTTATATFTYTPTKTPTFTSTTTKTFTPTATRTATLTATQTSTLTPSKTSTPTQTATRTKTATSTFTATRTPTSTYTRTATATPTKINNATSAVIVSRYAGFKLDVGGLAPLAYSSISTIGDVNSDGKREVIIGRYGASIGSGAVRVFDGNTVKPIATILGDRPQDDFGFSLTDLGDVNSDGISDFAVSAPGKSFNCVQPFPSSEASAYSGQVWVISGANMQTLYKVYGRPLAGFGKGIAAIDINKDGVRDLIVNANNDQRTNDSDPCTGVSGRIFVFSGRTGSQLRVQNVAKGLTHLVNLGDLNKDSVEDYALPYSGAPSGVQVFSGADGNLLSQIQLAGFNLNTVSKLGDVNGDTYPDFIVSASQISALNHKLRIYSGQNFGLLNSIDFEQHTVEHEATLGISDISGDNIPDVVILREGANDFGNSYIEFYSGANLAKLGSKRLHRRIVLSDGAQKITSLGNFDQDTFPDFAVSSLDDYYAYPNAQSNAYLVLSGKQSKLEPLFIIKNHWFASVNRLLY